MKTRAEIIQGVLTEFLGSDTTGEESYKDNFIGLLLDEEEIELLTTAIDEALERGNESKNQP